MNDKNSEALSLAFRRAKGKSLKIKELAIVPDLSAEATDKLIVKLAKAKAKVEDVKWETLVKGQRWYVEDLIKFSKMSAQERWDYEYQLVFPDLASEQELLTELESLV